MYDSVEVTLFGEKVKVHPVNRDINGNPRYVIHWLDLISEKAGTENAEYREIKNKLAGSGFREYRGRDFGGGFVFQSYNPQRDMEYLEKWLTPVTVVLDFTSERVKIVKPHHTSCNVSFCHIRVVERSDGYQTITFQDRAGKTMRNLGKFRTNVRAVYLPLGTQTEKEIQMRIATITGYGVHSAPY